MEGQPAPDAHRGVDGTALATVSMRTVQLLRRFAGKGPTRAKSYWADSDLLLIVLRGSLTQAEQHLTSAGHGREVQALRVALQDLLREPLCAMVEEVTGRAVVACMCAHHLDPDVTAEVLVLAPGEAASGGSLAVGEAVGSRSPAASRSGVELAAP